MRKGKCLYAPIGLSGFYAPIAFKKVHACEKPCPRKEKKEVKEEGPHRRVIFLFFLFKKLGKETKGLRKGTRGRTDSFCSVLFSYIYTPLSRSPLSIIVRDHTQS